MVKLKWPPQDTDERHGGRCSNAKYSLVSDCSATEGTSSVKLDFEGARRSSHARLLVRGEMQGLDGHLED